MGPSCRQLFLLSVVSVLALLGRPAQAQDVLVPRVLIISQTSTSDRDVNALPIVRRKQMASGAKAPHVGPIRWLTLSGRPIQEGAAVPPGGIRLLPVGPGRALVPLEGGAQEVFVVLLQVWRDGVRLDPNRAKVAMSRDLASELTLDPGTDRSSPEEIRFVICGSEEAIPSALSITASSREGRYLDGIRAFPLVSAALPPDVPGTTDRHTVCAASPQLRVVPEPVDRNHPLIASRSLLGEVGGSIVVEASGRLGVRLLVGAPSGLVTGGLDRTFRVRARILRTFVGGPPAIGGTDEEAQELAFAELKTAGRIWGQCGVTLDPSPQLAVEVVDPPQGSLLTIGCGEGMPASGGELRLLINGRSLVSRIRPGQTSRSVASRLAAQVRDLGFSVDLFANSLVQSRAHSSFDLVIRDRRGKLASVRPLHEGNLSTDSTLAACISELDLADGLDHFVDEDAASGTAEERVLLRLVGDADPTTIDLFVVPTFSGVGRIGESFIYTPGASVFNAVIIDRNGLRAGARSSTLAHELGHILLGVPGHPDDYGVDTPTSLMDADAADPTIYGPRRLSLSDCQQAIRQSNETTRLPLLLPRLP